MTVRRRSPGSTQRAKVITVVTNRMTVHAMVRKLGHVSPLWEHDRAVAEKTLTARELAQVDAAVRGDVADESWPYGSWRARHAIWLKFGDEELLQAEHALFGTWPRAVSAHLCTDVR